MDLWKNLWGRLDNQQYSGLNASKKKAAIQYQIDQKVFELNIRKIYWALVSNAELNA